MFRKKKETGEAAPLFAEPDLEPERRPRLTPDDVQKKEFRGRFRGYHEGEVDEFLDRVTEDLAALHEENKRLREQLGDPSGHRPFDLQAAEQRAEQIVREAREHAARLVTEAEKRAGEVAGSGGAGSATAPNWYLLRERNFLERLASLVKEHAEDLKRQARGQSADPAEPGEAPAAVPVAHPAPEESAPEEEEAEAAEDLEEPWEEPVGGQNSPGQDEEDPDTPRFEATAPMSPVAAPGGEPDLLSDWETTMRSGDQDVPRRPDEAASLKELFWGEDS